MYHLQTRQVPVCRFSLQRVCACISEDRRDGRWESEREGRWDKAGCLLLPATCLVQQADFVLWLKVKSFWTSTTPMNYTSLSLPPDAPPPTLSASHHHSLSSSLSPLRTQTACVNVSSRFSHMYLSQSSFRHMGCVVEECDTFVSISAPIHSSCFILQHLTILSCVPSLCVSS